MLIGVPKEIKNHEYRIGLTPSGARELTGRGAGPHSRLDAWAAGYWTGRAVKGAGRSRCKLVTAFVRVTFIWRT